MHAPVPNYTLAWLANSQKYNSRILPVMYELIQYCMISMVGGTAARINLLLLMYQKNCPPKAYEPPSAGVTPPAPLHNFTPSTNDPWESLLYQNGHE